MTARSKEREMELLQEAQQRIRIRKLAALTRIKGALDIPIDEHLDALAESLSPKKTKDTSSNDG